MDKDLAKVNFSLVGETLKQIGDYIYTRFLVLYELVKRHR